MARSMARDIREFVAKNLNDVGKFNTAAVVSLADGLWPTSNVSVALHDWAANDWIIAGYRITKEGKPGGRQTWEVVPANVAKSGDTFTGLIVDRRADGAILVRSGEKLFRVQALEW